MVLLAGGIVGCIVGRETGVTMVISAGSCDTATLAKAIAMTRESCKFMVVEVVSFRGICTDESDIVQIRCDSEAESSKNF